MSDFSGNANNVSYEGNMRDGVNVYPIPGGFVSSYCSGWKNVASLHSHDSFSPLLQMRWSQVCRAFNSGI